MLPLADLNPHAWHDRVVVLPSHDTAFARFFPLGVLLMLKEAADILLHIQPTPLTILLSLLACRGCEGQGQDGQPQDTGHAEWGSGSQRELTSTLSRSTNVEHATQGAALALDAYSTT